MALWSFLATAVTGDVPLVKFATQPMPSDPNSAVFSVSVPGPGSSTFPRRYRVGEARFTFVQQTDEGEGPGLLVTPDGEPDGDDDYVELWIAVPSNPYRLVRRVGSTRSTLHDLNVPGGVVSFGCEEAEDGVTDFTVASGTSALALIAVRVVPDTEDTRYDAEDRFVATELVSVSVEITYVLDVGDAAPGPWVTDAFDPADVTLPCYVGKSTVRGDVSYHALAMGDPVYNLQSNLIVVPLIFSDYDGPETTGVLYLRCDLEHANGVPQTSVYRIDASTGALADPLGKILVTDGIGATAQAVPIPVNVLGDSGYTLGIAAFISGGHDDIPLNPMSITGGFSAGGLT